jgi:hypothetical protein
MGKPGRASILRVIVKEQTPEAVGAIMRGVWSEKAHVN